MGSFSHIIDGARASTLVVGIYNPCKKISRSIALIEEGNTSCSRVSIEEIDFLSDATNMKFLKPV